MTSVLGHGRRERLTFINMKSKIFIYLTLKNVVSAKELQAQKTHGTLK